jgi:hypothetical protein
MDAPFTAATGPTHLLASCITLQSCVHYLPAVPKSLLTCMSSQFLLLLRTNTLSRNTQQQLCSPSTGRSWFTAWLFTAVTLTLDSTVHNTTQPTPRPQKWLIYCLSFVKKFLSLAFFASLHHSLPTLGNVLEGHAYCVGRNTRGGGERDSTSPRAVHNPATSGRPRQSTPRGNICYNISGKFSSSFLVLLGISQGSTLGPLLFNIFINDICNKIHYSSFLLFADDRKLYYVVKSVRIANAYKLTYIWYESGVLKIAWN